MDVLNRMIPFFTNARCPAVFRSVTFSVVFGVVISFSALAQNAARQPAQPSPWADFVETDFPFISSVLDARKAGAGWPDNNLTPRGLILNLSNNAWACFDTDLLRVSAIWIGNGVTPESMPQMSYHNARGRPPMGQTRLPQIRGTPWLANGIYPGWQSGETFTLDDPRERAPDPTEVGLGPIDPASGEFKSVRITADGAVLEYIVAGARVTERIESRLVEGQPVVQRTIQLSSVPKTLWLLLGSRPESEDRLNIVLLPEPGGDGRSAELVSRLGVTAVRVNQTSRPVSFRVAMGLSSELRPWTNSASSSPRRRWNESATTSGVLSTNGGAYVVDNIEMPLNNPWKRNVRPVDLAFYKDGRAAVVTFEGDVWMVSGLGNDLGRVIWKRFTSGLHEPMGITLRNGELFVFDRHGIWRLIDSNGDGEADLHELFCNRFAQTAETREYACGIRVAPDNSFVIAKGGIATSTIGRQNGTVLRVSPDGKNVTTLGRGLREPFIGVHPKTGMITSSDQEGNYVPTTPLHIIRDNQFYGFLPAKHPKEEYPGPIAEPLTWIPRQANASAMSQVWLVGAKMGRLNDALVHIGYYRPELFVVLLNQRAARLQAAVVSLTQDLALAPLNGAVNPIDGQLYVGGFQIWGTRARQISGLARVRFTGAPSTLPVEITPMTEGILLKFDVPLDIPHALSPASYVVERWNYRRTSGYGSPHFKLDGSRGQETMIPSSAYISRDRKSVFVGIPDMKAGVHQMRLAWSLQTDGGAKFEDTAFFTPYELVQFNPTREGFEALTVDLTVRAAETAATPITVEEGKRLSELYGCLSCHSLDGSTAGRIGPTWKGLFGSEVILVDGTRTIADHEYLRRSIDDPRAQIPRGFDGPDTQMPSYEGILNKQQVEALILYIKSLDGGGDVDVE